MLSADTGVVLTLQPNLDNARQCRLGNMLTSTTTKTNTHATETRDGFFLCFQQHVVSQLDFK